jgi:CIC family chloride channel protein
MLGGAVGTVAHRFLPGYVATPGVYGLVGMGTAFAGIIRAPMTSVLMIFEITRDYAVIVPLMISNLVSFFISSRLQREPIYEVLAQQDGIHLPSGEWREQRQVALAMRPPTDVLGPDMAVREALDKARSGEFRAWLIGDTRRVQGVIDIDRLERALADGAVEEPLHNLLDSGHDFPHLHVDHSLNLALERMGATHTDLLPVVSRADIHDLLGVVTLRDIMGLYGFANALSAPEPSALTKASKDPAD